MHNLSQPFPKTSACFGHEGTRKPANKAKASCKLHKKKKRPFAYLNCLKAQNQNKPEVEGNLKENLKIKDKTHQKSKRWKRIIIMKIPTITTIIHQIRVEATDLIMVRAETDNLGDLSHEIEDKELNIVNVSFRTTAIREVHRNKIVHNMVAHKNRISKGTK